MPLKTVYFAQGNFYAPKCVTEELLREGREQKESHFNSVFANMLKVGLFHREWAFAEVSTVSDILGALMFHLLHSCG